MLTSTPRRPGCLLLRALQGALVGLTVAVGLHFAVVLAGDNFRTVLPGRVYRSAQPAPDQLEAAVREYGIRTVVNLRGPGVTVPWYRAQAEATAGLDICQEDLSFSATRLPSAESLRRLVEVFERAEPPFLLHCQQGADRTGLASVVAVILLADATLEEAMAQLGPASGHVPLGRTAAIDRFFAMYRDWLRQQGREHSRQVFRQWATVRYCGGVGRADFALIGGTRVQAGEANLVTVRCRNTADEAWRFEPGPTAGVHGNWLLFDRDGRTLAGGRTGLRRALVEPGESIDLAVPLPPLPPGAYTLLFDLFEEQQGSFLQLGNDPLEAAVEVE